MSLSGFGSLEEPAEVGTRSLEESSRLVFDVKERTLAKAILETTTRAAITEITEITGITEITESERKTEDRRTLRRRVLAAILADASTGSGSYVENYSGGRGGE